MANERGTVVFKFLADVKDLARGTKQVENEISGMAKRSSSIFNKSFSKITSTISSKFGAVGQEASAAMNGMANSAVSAGSTLGIGIAAGAATAGAAIVGLATKGIAKFQALASEIRGMERATGANAETASRLVATLNALHIETSAGQRAFFLLSKTIDTNSKRLTDHGIQVAKNKDGSVDLYQTLLNVRTAYRAAGAGAEGSAIAAAAFGRSAQSLLPLLGATSERLNDIDEAARKHHEFLTQDQIDKAKELGIATTELHHATEGLSIELGSSLVPEATKAARAMTRLVEIVDTGKGVLGRLVDAIPGVREIRLGLDLLGGKHKEAAKAAEENADAEKDFADTIAYNASQALATYNGLLDDTLGAHLKAENSSSSFADALQKLADDSKGVDESVSGATAKVRTFQDAMHEEFDSLVDANEAALDYADSLDALNEALHGAAAGSEDAAAARDRLTRGGKMASDPRAIKRATDAAVKAAEQEVDAEVASGQVADTAAARKEALRQKLVEIQKQYPEVASAVGQYIDKLDKIPNLTTKAEDSTKKLSKAKKDLAGDIVDVISKAKDEIGAMKLSSDQVEDAWKKHWKLLDVLNYLKAAYPALADIIETFITDVDQAWTDFLGSPAAAPAIAGSFAPGSFGAPVTGVSGPNTSQAAADAQRALANSFGSGSFGSDTATGSALEGPTTVHITQNIQGDGLNSKEVADLAAKRAQRALVGSRAS